MIAASKKIGKLIGVDSAIAYTVLSRIIQAGGGVVSIFFVTRFLSSNEQGYYYTFASIIAIQIFFELGLSSIITQYTAYEFAHLGWGYNYTIEGNEKYKSRISSLLRFCVKWFGIISVILLFVLLLAGYFFFSSYAKGAKIDWKMPWFIMCIATSLNLFIDPILAFFDGLGHVKDMAKVRLIQKITNVLLLYLFFALGLKLYSSPLAGIVAIGVNYIQIVFSNRIKYLRTIWSLKGEWVVDYVKEIFPVQWKIGLSWISGYFMYQLFNPVLFATEGPIVAGQMGMTLAALNGVLSISISWINTKVPLFSTLIAKKEYNNLDKIFNKTLKLASLICIICLAILVILVYILRYNKLTVGNRFLPILPLILLSITSFVNQYVSALATYLRCHKKEPFLVFSIVMAILTASSTLILGRRFGINGIIYSYSFLTIFLSLPWAITLFRKLKHQWHQ